MIDDPINESVLKADVTTLLFGLQPLMSEDFLTLSLKLSVEGQMLDSVLVLRWHFVWGRHSGLTSSIPETTLIYHVGREWQVNIGAIGKGGFDSKGGSSENLRRLRSGAGCVLSTGRGEREKR
ncbi:MAG: hypothetical protein M2R45_01659 [Verrucomicrobia subdivision 3 bacterium]|nr:hypothetical protein [Limisphaerales bacterium]MCS1412810.1 hypothetical protein [Limisphaerales bacterium]